MARQVINTDPPIGDPAPTAFNKVNAMTLELYGFNLSAGGLVAGSLRIRPVASGDQFFIRNEGATGVTIDAVNNANSAYAVATLRGSAVNIVGATTVSSNLTVSGQVSSSQNFASTTQNIVIAGGQSTGTIYMRPRGVADATGQATLSPAGVMSAPSFNPTSSADVKDYIEGYAGDADGDLNRLVVVTHKYRPEFLDSDKTYISLLAENVHSVVPSATDGNYDVVEKEPFERVVLVPVQVPDEDGVGAHEVNMEVTETAWRDVTRHIPMNVNPMAILALCVRSHQTKDARIRALEAAVAELQAARPPAGASP